MKTYKFKPGINFYEAEYYLDRQSLNPIVIKNSEIFNMVKGLTKQARFSYKDKSEKRWEDFYLPLKRAEKQICIPFNVVKYKNEFFCYFFRLGSLHIKKGNKETEKIFKKIFQEAIGFVRVVKSAEEEIFERIVPYDFRTGKIQGKYVLNKLLPQKEKIKILNDYNCHVENTIKTDGCSLNEYLQTASICYKAAFGRKAARLKPLDMHKRWADNRDGGMFSIKDWDSKSEFQNWYNSEKWAGSHPFEIVFSWHEHGIHLYPLSPHNLWRYSLRVTNYAYASGFIKIVKALIKNKIAFIGENLQEVLDCLAGESYFTVNDYSGNFFFYSHSKEDKKKYFKHIQWDKLKRLRCKA